MTQDTTTSISKPTTMLSNSVYYIEDLCSSQIDALTELLQLDPAFPAVGKWFQFQSKLIAALPPSLRKPTSLLDPKTLSYKLPSSRKALLCQTHKSLNKFLIRRIFLQITAECTTRNKRLDVHADTLPPPLAAFLARLKRINSLWMTPELYHNAFGPGETYTRIPSDCEACILAYIGGNPQILADLRSSCLGRWRRRHHEPRLLPLLESWLEWTGKEEVWTYSGKLGSELEEWRRTRRKLRRERQKQESEMRLSELSAARRSEDTEAAETEHALNEHQVEGEQAAADEQAFEGTIIDHYTAIMASSVVRKDAIHPAFATSVPGPLSNNEGHIPIGYTVSIYTSAPPPTASIYNQNVGRPHSLARRHAPEITAAERSRAYREALGFKDEEKGGVARGTQRDEVGEGEDENENTEYKPIPWRAPN